MKKLPPVIMKCMECGKNVLCEGRKGRKSVLRGRAYCSEDCKKQYLSKLSSKTMAKTNRKYASQRMKLNNPMKRPEVRKRVSTTLRAMGWKPPVQGGNGKPIPIPQKLLACSIGWDMEVAIKTKMERHSGYPPCYKVDIGSILLKTAIEVDGNSHCALDRKRKDAKKVAFLESIGWKVLRFSNEEVMEHLEDCVQMVLSTISK